MTVVKELKPGQIDTIRALYTVNQYSTFTRAGQVVAPTSFVASQLEITNDAAGKRLERLADAGYVIKAPLRTSGAKFAWRLNARGKKLAERVA